MKHYRLHLYGRMTDCRLIVQHNPDKSFPTPYKSGLTCVDCNSIFRCSKSLTFFIVIKKLILNFLTKYLQKHHNLVKLKV